MTEEKAERREKFQSATRPKWGIESTEEFFALWLLFTPKHSCHVQLSELKDCFLRYCPTQAESVGNWLAHMVGSRFCLLVSEMWESSVTAVRRYSASQHLFQSWAFLSQIRDIKPLLRKAHTHTWISVNNLKGFTYFLTPSYDSPLGHRFQVKDFLY